MGTRSMEVVWDSPGQINASTLDRWDYSIELACLQGPEDLQLAAELGKTLLERNKELENNLKQQQNTIDEQAQEIEYMKKQTAALREVNDSRLRVYEQLEVSIQDLERANHRLALENSSDKKQIKSQGTNIESLEGRCEELQKKLDELTDEHEALLRRLQINNDGQNNCQQTRVAAIWKAKVSQEGSMEQVAAPSTPSSVSLDRSLSGIDTGIIRDLASTLASDDEVTDLLRQLHEARNQRAREQKRVVELGEQLNSILQENANLEEQLNVWRHKAEDMKNLQDEISTLEEVRQGHLCGRCLRGIDDRTHDALSIMLDQEEDDDLSLIESVMTDSHRESGTPLPQENCQTTEDEEVEDNPYRVLVEKYEALLEVQRQPAPRRKTSGGPTMGGACLSLQEELSMSGDFSSFTTSAQLDLRTGNQELNKTGVVEFRGKREAARSVSGCCKNKPFSGTPTDLSEAESSSSGFSDETSNKATQTEDRTGSLLCSIADGEDCKFSIYDDASPIESRFRKTPEYRQLFREIFGVLKRAAEAKDEGEKLPLLDDSTTTTTTTATTTTTTTATKKDKRENDSNRRQNLDIVDDSLSVVSSVISSVVSEPVQPFDRCQTPVTGKVKPSSAGEKVEETTTPQTPKTPTPTQVSRQLYTPLKRQPLEYLSIGVNVRKKSSAKKNSAKKLSATLTSSERPTTPDYSVIGVNTNPKIIQSKSNSGGRRRFRAPFTAVEQTNENLAGVGGGVGGGGTVWNGNTLNFFPTKTGRETSTTTRSDRSSPAARQNNDSFVRYVSEHHNTTYEYRPSAASAEVARLKRLEMSYAEALRMPNKPKTSNNRRH